MQDGLVALRTRGTYSVGEFYPSQSHSRLGPRPAGLAFLPPRSRPRSRSDSESYLEMIHSFLWSPLGDADTKAVAVKKCESFDEVML